MSFFTELKRRKVIRVAAAYLVVGWVIIEVASTVAPNLNLPEWTARMVTLLVILGFPLALILAWIFEVTPEGMHVTEGRTGSKRFYGMVALITVAALTWALWPGSGAEHVPRGASAPLTAAPAIVEHRAPDLAGEGADESTIAVLPFVNMSANAENVFFAEGIAEELLNILAGIEGLKVASRTSAFAFKGTVTPIPEIARQLGVRHILEGSVRRQGNRVRITAQLIEASSDTHLWSSTFERDLVDIFRVQEEIAQAITIALKDVLGVRTITVAAATDNLEAYDRFLRGRSRFYQRRNLDDAIADLGVAVQQDPDFAEAWAFLAAASYVVGIGNYPTMYEEDGLLAAAMEAADRALALDPALATALGVKGQMHTREHTAARRIEGIRMLERAAGLPSPDTSSRLWLGLSLMELGLAERARPHLEQAFEQDPLVQINVGYLGVNNLIRGDIGEGQRLIDRAVELGGHNFWFRLLLVELVNRGEFAAADALLAAFSSSLGPHAEDLARELRAAYADPAQRNTYLSSLRARAAASDQWRALLPALMLRDPELAVEQVENDVDRIVLTLSAWMPSLGWLRDSPEFHEYMRSVGSIGFWEVEGYPPGCRAIDDPAGRRLDCSGYGP